MRDGWDYVAICDVQLIDETDQAGLFLVEGEEVWLPWSQVDESSIPGEDEEGDVYVRRWITIENDLPYVKLTVDFSPDNRMLVRSLP